VAKLYAWPVMRLPEHLKKAPVGVERLSRDALSRHQRQRIIKAAIDVFAKRGFQNTSIDNIVAASEASVGGFYLLFDGKDDCFVHCYDSVTADIRAAVAEASSETSSWVARLTTAVITILRYAEEHPLPARLVLIEAQTAGPAGVERYSETMTGLSRALRGGRELTSRGDELPPRLEDASSAGAAWLLHQRLARGEAAGVVELLPEFLAILAGSYIGEAKARAHARRALSAKA